MKKLLILFLLAITFGSFAQVPEDYYPINTPINNIVSTLGIAEIHFSLNRDYLIFTSLADSIQFLTDTTYIETDSTENLKESISNNEKKIYSKSSHYFIYNIAEEKIENDFYLPKKLNTHWKFYVSNNDSLLITKKRKYWQTNIFTGETKQIEKPDSLILMEHYILKENSFSCDHKYFFKYDYGLEIYSSKNKLKCFTTTNEEHLKFKIPSEYVFTKKLEPCSNNKLILFDYLIDNNYLVASYGYRPTHLVFYDINTWKIKFEYKIQGFVRLRESWFDMDSSHIFILDKGNYFSKKSLNIETGETSKLSWRNAWEKLDTTKSNNESFKRVNLYKYHISENNSGRLGLYTSLRDSYNNYVSYYENQIFDGPASWGLIIGASGIKNNFVEIGIARDIGTTTSSEPKSFGGYYLTYEQSTVDNELKGLNMTFFAGAGLGLGLNYNYYFRNNESRHGIKPLIGIAVFRFFLTYGYNFAITNKSMENVSKNEFALRYHIPLFYKKRL